MLQLAEVIQIWAIKAQTVEPSFGNARFWANIRPNLTPFGMINCSDLVKTGGKIDGYVDIKSFGSFILCPEQIEFQMRMLFAHLRGMVTPPMMALGKAGNGIDVTKFQRVLPLFPIKFNADIFNQGRGVKIQMYLSKT